MKPEDVASALMNVGRNAMIRHLRISGPGIPTFEEKVRAVLAAVLPEHEKQLRAERDALKAELAKTGRTLGEITRANEGLGELVNEITAELAEARAAIERAKAIHAPEQYHDELQPWCTYCNRDDNQRDDVVLWPCPTLAALAVPESGVVIERDAFGPSAVRVVDMLKTPDAPTGGEADR